MVRRTRTRGRIHKRRGARRSLGLRGMRKKVRRAYEVAVKERPPKHFTISSLGVTGATNKSLADIRSTVPAGVFLTSIPRSDGTTTVQSRIGDIVHISRISLKIQLSFGSAISGDIGVKLFLVQRKDSAGASFTATQFCQDYFGGTVWSTNVVPNINNKDFHSRWHILKTLSWHMKETVAGVTELANLHLEYRKHALKIWHGLTAAGGEAAVDNGGIYLFAISDTGTTGINAYLDGNIWFRDQA
jgi:hypothetical protein